MLKEGGSGSDWKTTRKKEIEDRLSGIEIGLQVLGIPEDGDEAKKVSRSRFFEEKRRLQDELRDLESK
jgi:hypothetical protein